MDNYALDAGYQADAYKAFRSVSGANNATYRTKFNARIKQSEVFMGRNIEDEVKSLRSMVKYDRNKDYLDQIYYAIGNLYLSRNDTAQAIENYVLAAEKSTRGGIEKAISQLTLGRIYFEQGKYSDAQPCYAEAVPLIGETYPGYDSLKLRSDVLDELAVYSQNVELQDSLLRLSAMTPEEQKAVAEKNHCRIEETRGRGGRSGAQGGISCATSGNGQPAWQPKQCSVKFHDEYRRFVVFLQYSHQEMPEKTAFQKAWGSRKLEDDWRRRNKATFSMDEFEEVDYDALDEEFARGRLGA